MVRKIARTICGIVIFGVILLCVVHAAVQLITGGPLDHGDWIGIIFFAAVVLMAVSHMKRFRKKRTEPGG
jgi:membrane protein implicated in regulation of membrane protease activity